MSLLVKNFTCQKPILRAGIFGELLSVETFESFPSTLLGSKPSRSNMLKRNLNDDFRRNVFDMAS